MNDMAPHVAPEETEASLLDPLMVIAENARLLVFGPIVAGLIALGLAFTMTPTYTAGTRLLPPQQQQSMASLIASQLGVAAGAASLSSAMAGLRNPMELYVSIVRSRSIGDGLVERFDLMKVYGVGSKAAARRRLEVATVVQTGKDGLITIEVEDTSPQRAAQLANGYVEELFKLLGRLAVTEAQQRRAFFETQLANTQNNLKKAELALGSAGAGEGVLQSAPSVLMAGIAQLRAQITAQEIRLSSMRGYLSETSPQFQQAQRELASLRSQLAQAQRNKPTDGSGPEYLTRYRDYKYYETLFDLMAKQYELARLDEAREGAPLQVVDVAIPPESKSKPRRGQIAVNSAVGVALLLLIFVFARRGFRNALAQPSAAGKVARIRAGLWSLLPLRRS